MADHADLHCSRVCDAPRRERIAGDARRTEVHQTSRLNRISASPGGQDAP